VRGSLSIGLPAGLEVGADNDSVGSGVRVVRVRVREGNVELRGTAVNGLSVLVSNEMWNKPWQSTKNQQLEERCSAHDSGVDKGNKERSTGAITSHQEET
jgi:hypothetical protein